MKYFRCPKCQITLAVAMADASSSPATQYACCPKCGEQLVPDPEAEGASKSGPRAAMTTMSMDEFRPMFLRSAVLAQQFIVNAKDLKEKPFEIAMAHTLALVTLCKTFKFEPDEVLRVVQDMVIHAGV